VAGWGKLRQNKSMKEKEASLIASFVAEVINHFDEPAIKEEVRQKVKALIKAFPIYRKLEL
jgi:glycine/serine hydroxymethyltransferase